MSYFLKYLIAFFTLFKCVYVFSQQNPYLDIKFRNITTKEGLSSNSVQACLLDSYGFMWIGTQTGLNRYDGTSVKVFNYNSSDSCSIGDGFIWSIYEDSENILWIGTNSGGLNKYDRVTERFTRFMHKTEDSNSITSNAVRCITEDGDKNLWLSTENGINKFDRKTQKFRRYFRSETDSHTISSNNSITIFKDKSGIIYAGGKHGLNKYIKEKDNFLRIQLTGNDNFDILCISQDASGVLWIGTHRYGIFKYSDSDGSVENIMPIPGEKNSLASTAVRAIVHCDNGLIWIAHVTEKAGVDVFDSNTGIYSNFKHDKYDNRSLALNVSWDIYKDKHGGIWICTNGGGVSYYSEYALKFNHINKLYGDGYSRDLKVVWSVIYAKDRFWCYTEGTVLTFDKYGGFIKEYNLAYTKLKLFNPLYAGKTSGRIYASSLDSGLTYYESTADNFKACPFKFINPLNRFNTAGTIHEDKEGNIWIGSDKGLQKFDRNFNEIRIFPDNDSLKVSYLKKCSGNTYRDSGDYLWFGGDGLSKINLKTNELINLKPNDKLPANPSGDKLVSSFYEDGKGSIWIAYNGNGFDKFDIQSSTFEHYNVTKGLPTNYIFSVFPGINNYLWFSSVKGIIKFNTVSEKITVYGIDEGAQDEEFNENCFFRSDDGMVVYSGVNGINWFYPDRIKINTNVPPIVFTSFRVYNKELFLPQSITQTKEITLSYTNNFFTLEFASLDYVNPARNCYSYMLEGIDETWINSGNKHEANYTEIEPGEYVFKVKASNNDGIWNEEGNSIKITITPPWWQRWWFKGSLVCVVLGSLVLGIRNRFSKIRKEKQTQEEYTRKLIDSHEEERKKLSAELHDSLGQDLIIIKNSANMAIQKLKTEPDAVKFINQISEISLSALNNVRAISHNLRPAELDKLGLTETIKSMVETVSSSSGIEFKSDLENIDGVFEKNSEVNFCRIVQECMNNILKHSKAAFASLIIRFKDGSVLTSVKDNGIGFDYKEIMDRPIGLSFGLKGISERVRMMNGTFQINSRSGEGTEITIIIPVYYKT